MTTLYCEEQKDLIERTALAMIEEDGFLVNKLGKYLINEKGMPFIEWVRATREAKKEIISKRGKRKRIKKRLQEWEKQGDLYFATLTFKDETLNKTTKEERRKAISSDLNATSDNYIANADYGDLRGREHFHALILNLNQDELRRRRKEIGFVDVEKISRTLGVAIDYCMKLTNHTLKNSTDGKIIYCRKTKKKLQEGIDLLNDELES